MDYFSLFRPALFLLPAEAAHHLAIFVLRHDLLPAQPDYHHPCLESNVFDLHFMNPVGLAAGFDKNAEALKGLSRQGFGFIETGTVTPRAQKGNEKPRLFRLHKDGAIINRMGFNNEGKDAYVQQLTNWKQRKNPHTSSPIVGVNIGKNKTSDDALADYIELLEALYPLAGYITVNISSPNTPGLRHLQKKEALHALILGIQEKCTSLRQEYKKHTPLLVKIAPDLTLEEEKDIASTLLELKTDGIIISNTTISAREHLKTHKYIQETGGLSGTPLFHHSTEVLRRIYQHTEGKMPLIGVGGVASAEDAYTKIRAGASLIQLYSALIYNGFSLVTDIKKGLATRLEQDGFSSISEAVGRSLTHS